jgi:hypothetical protein
MSCNVFQAHLFLIKRHLEVTNKTKIKTGNFTTQTHSEIRLYVLMNKCSSDNEMQLRHILSGNSFDTGTLITIILWRCPVRLSV